MAKISSEVARFRTRIEPTARLRFKRGWIAGLAILAEVPEGTLRTLFYRGQKLDATVVRKIETALGLSVAPGTEADELQDMLERVRQLYRLKTQYDPPRREHDWRVLVALLNAPPESDRERRRSQRRP